MSTKIENNYEDKNNTVLKDIRTALFILIFVVACC